MRKCLVVSAVNFTEGGTLTVLRDCLASASSSLSPEWDIVALVHDKSLINESRVQFIEYPYAKRSWFLRLYYEWFGFLRLSRALKPNLWLSLHDITPRVSACRQAVYCHNPSPFYKLKWSEILMDPKFWLFNRFYRYLYSVFIHRNNWVIVQQAWLRDEFLRMFGKLSVVVAHPSVSLPDIPMQKKVPEQVYVFLYPSLPRIFKNFEIICEAAMILQSRGVDYFEIRLTVSGHENAYSSWLHDKYKNIKTVNFIGLQDRNQMYEQYCEASAVIFPSKLETWGLPISEAKLYGKLLLLSDLPYAHETVGSYEKVSFFNPVNASDLADLMQETLEGHVQPAGAIEIEPSQPYTSNWPELWGLLIDDL
jgi:glycosyltransferase involved in cell wall biosynthesis